MDQRNVTQTYRIFHPTTAEYILIRQFIELSPKYFRP
jgi:hypothetical protein